MDDTKQACLFCGEMAVLNGDGECAKCSWEDEEAVDALAPIRVWDKEQSRHLLDRLAQAKSKTT